MPGRRRQSAQDAKRSEGTFRLHMRINERVVRRLGWHVPCCRMGIKKPKRAAARHAMTKTFKATADLTRRTWLAQHGLGKVCRPERAGSDKAAGQDQPCIPR